MKDSINLVENFTRPSLTKNFGLKNLGKRLKKANLILVCLLFVLLFGLIASNVLSRTETRLLSKAEAEISALSEQAKIVETVVTRQAQLSAIKKGVLDLRGKTDLIQRSIPSDVVLSQLNMNSAKTSFTAKTRSVESFSQFVQSLKSSRGCKTISLVGTSFDDKSGVVQFSLECLTN